MQICLKVIELVDGKIVKNEKKKTRTRDLFFVALYGVRRKGRATLTSIGIGIGIAIVAVSGISASKGLIYYQLLSHEQSGKASPQAGFLELRRFTKSLGMVKLTS